VFAFGSDSCEHYLTHLKFRNDTFVSAEFHLYYEKPYIFASIH